MGTRVSPHFAIGGVWRSLVAHLFWEQGVVSSNLTTPTILREAGIKSDARVPESLTGQPDKGLPTIKAGE